jgi:hypothetical protein
MECPNRDTNNCDGEIVFEICTEEQDSGDGVYFQSWTTRYAIYDKEASVHVEGCVLIDEQILKLEEDRNKELVNEPWDDELDY